MAQSESYAQEMKISSEEVHNLKAELFMVFKNENPSPQLALTALLGCVEEITDGNQVAIQINGVTYEFKKVEELTTEMKA